jgi:hypothetical protein
MVRNFLNALAKKEKQLIKDRTNALVDLLENWAQQYPKLGPVIPMIALTSAVAMPYVSITDAFAWARAIAWIFLVDYKADPQTFTYQDMQQKATQWYSIAIDWPASKVDTGDELTAELADITNDMSKSCLFETLREYWAVRLQDHVLNVAQECQNALEYTHHGPHTLPSLDDYLRIGIRSVGYPFVGSLAMILHRDSSVLECIEQINEILECAGAALRLYNDIATLDKEIQAGEVNSIMVVYHTLLDKESGPTEESVLSEAKQYILRLADSYAQTCYNLVEQLGTDSKQFEVMSYQLVALHAHFYGHTEQDYHTTSLEKVHQMFSENLL